MCKFVSSAFLWVPLLVPDYSKPWSAPFDDVVHVDRHVHVPVPLSVMFHVHLELLPNMAIIMIEEQFKVSHRCKINTNSNLPFSWMSVERPASVVFTIKSFPTRKTVLFKSFPWTSRDPLWGVPLSDCTGHTPMGIWVHLMNIFIFEDRVQNCKKMGHFICTCMTSAKSRLVQGRQGGCWKAQSGDAREILNEERNTKNPF